MASPDYTTTSLFCADSSRFSRKILLFPGVSLIIETKPGRQDMQMETDTLPRKFNQLELWWWALPESARWMAGCTSLAVFLGVTGGVLA
jgi:hypothetical protein